MKRFALFITLLIPVLLSSQSCLPEGITFLTQEQIDNFQTDNPECSEIEGDVFIEGGTNIVSLNGLNVVTSIGGYLIIAGNDSLYSLEGLENLQTIGGGLSIGNYYSWCAGNPNLSDISALFNLTSIGGGLVVCGSSLSSLEGLENIDPISISGVIFILDNPMLSHCEVQSICDYLAVPGSYLDVNSNAIGCNSQEEIEEACETVSVNELVFLNKTKAHPNPFTTSTTIEFQLDQPSEVILTIFNHLGEQIELIRQNQQQGKQQITWNAEGLPPGMYFFTLQAGDHVASGKMVLVR